LKTFKDVNDRLELEAEDARKSCWVKLMRTFGCSPRSYIYLYQYPRSLHWRSPSPTVRNHLRSCPSPTSFG